jgi:hypothetical protein
MAVNVLFASHDLDFHELLKDVINITYKNVKLDKVLDHEKMIEILGNSRNRYHLIIMDSHFVESEGKHAISILAERFPAMLNRTVLVVDPATPLPELPAGANIPVIEKPFSLDTFGETVKKICPAR